MPRHPRLSSAGTAILLHWVQLPAGPASPRAKEGPGKGWPDRRAAGAGRRVHTSRSLSDLAGAHEQPLEKRASLAAVLLLREMCVPLPPLAAYDKWLSVDMTATGGGSLAPVHVSTLDLLRVHWPEIMSPMQVGGRNVRSGRFGFFFFFPPFLIH